MNGFQAFLSMLRDQFLSSWGPISEADALGLYRREATIEEAAEMIAIARERPLADLTDRQKDLADSMPGFPRLCSIEPVLIDGAFAIAIKNDWGW